MDVWYVENVSLLLDLRIFFSTIKVVLKQEGISGGGSVTMTEFIGNTK